MRLRHVVNVMRPAENQGTRGEIEGKDKLIRRDVPCSIDTLTVREVQHVQSMWPEATYRIEMYADPSRQVTPGDYLTGQSLGERKLYVVGVVDVETLGVVARLFCSEAL